MSKTCMPMMRTFRPSAVSVHISNLVLFLQVRHHALRLHFQIQNCHQTRCISLHSPQAPEMYMHQSMHDYSRQDQIEVAGPGEVAHC